MEFDLLALPNLTYFDPFAGDTPPPSPTPSASNITMIDEDSEEFAKMVEEAQESERKKYEPCDQMAYLYIMQQEPYDRMQSSHSSAG